MTGGIGLSEMLLVLVLKLGEGLFLARKLPDAASLRDVVEALLALKLVQGLSSIFLRFLCPLQWLVIGGELDGLVC